MVEREREVVTVAPSAEQIGKRAAAGWRIAAVEWERAPQEKSTDGSAQVEIPFGLRVGDDRFHLEENPVERSILIIVMNAIVDDRPLSHAVAELNEAGYRTREGRDWTTADAFNLLPLLIEAGPRIFASSDWIARRTHPAVAS